MNDNERGDFIADIWARMAIKEQTPTFKKGIFEVQIPRYSEAEPEKIESVDHVTFERKCIGVWAKTNSLDRLAWLEVSAEGNIILRGFKSFDASECPSVGEYV